MMTMNMECLKSHGELSWQYLNIFGAFTKQLGGFFLDKGIEFEFRVCVV